MCLTVNAQVKTDTELYKTIISKDSLLFNIGFNTCDIHQFEDLLSEDFEFFHDKDSISLKPQFLYGIKNGLCKSPDKYQSRRELEAGSTEIYPLYQKDVLYGAIQIGIHSFYENMAGQREAYGSTAKFTHVWLLQHGTWKLARSLSYDHQTGEHKKN
jgi:hypothetical protein